MANEYIRKRCLTLAAQELQTTDISVIEAAYKYGCESPESFSKAFSRFHGASPGQAKRKGTKLHLFNPLVIKIILEGGSVMDYRIEHKESQRFLALVRPFLNESFKDDNDHSIPDFWGECSEKDLIEPMKMLRVEGKRDLYGLCNPVSALRPGRRLSGGNLEQVFFRNWYTVDLLKVRRCILLAFNKN